MFLKSRGKLTPFCPLQQGPLNILIADTCTAVVDACMDSKVTRTRGSCIGITKLAYELSGNSNQCLIKTDKDGGFVVASTTDIIMARRRALDAAWYQPCSRLSCAGEAVILEYIDIRKEIGKLYKKDEYDNTVENFLLSDIRTVQDSSHDRVVAVDGLVSKLLVTVKTHKPQGEIKERAVHASSASPFKPGYRWIASVVRRTTSKYKFLLNKSKELVERLNRTYVAPGRVLIKIDVKDYFMSGDHGEPVDETAKNVVRDKERAAYRKLLSFFLRNQYVQVDKSDKIWRTVIGSGMGCICSGDVSDLALANTMEIGYAADPEIQRQYSVDLYI